MSRLRKAKPPIDPTAIPERLRLTPRWVNWDFFPPDKEGAKDRKVPLVPGGSYGCD